jgi:hypothetical protein
MVKTSRRIRHIFYHTFFQILVDVGVFALMLIPDLAHNVIDRFIQPFISSAVFRTTFALSQYVFLIVALVAFLARIVLDARHLVGSLSKSYETEQDLKE